MFGLSMDYHVFILRRIRERRNRGAATTSAITGGIASSAGVVTSAAVIMVAVFSIFATLLDIAFKMFGVGMAAAVLIDATIVRGILLPATMTLLGDRNWYLPATRLAYLAAPDRAGSYCPPGRTGADGDGQGWSNRCRRCAMAAASAP